RPRPGHRRQIPNPAADARTLADIDCLDISADLPNTAQYLGIQVFIHRLARRRGHKPGCSLEKIRCGHFHPRSLFSCHRVPGQESLTYAIAESFCSLCHDLALGAASISEQRVGWKRRAKTPDQFDDCADWSSQKN